MPHRRARALVSLVVLLASGAALAAEPAAKAMSLSVGAQRVLAVPDVRELEVADRAIADATTVGEGQVVVRGEGAGQTTVVVTTGGGKKVKFQVSVSAERAAAATAPAADAGAPAKAAPSGTPLALNVGVERVVKLAGLDGVAALDPEVADARAIGKGAVVIRGIAVGTGRVVLLHKGGKPVEYAVKVTARP